MNRERGFTLIEVMVAATLFAMLLVATLAAMRTFGNTSTTLRAVTERADEMRAVSEYLRQSIGSAMPVVMVGDTLGDFETDQGFGTFFFGSSSQLIWVAPLVAGADLGGTFIMQLKRTEDRLELRWLPYQREADAISWGDAEPKILLQPVDKFEVGYLAAVGGEWESEWRGADKMPMAVRLNIRARERYWPELVMHLGGAKLNLR